MTTASPAKPGWASTTPSKSRSPPAWETIDNDKIKAPPQIKGLQSPEAAEPKACDDFRAPMSEGKTSTKWTCNLRSESKEEAKGRPGFWSPGAGRGTAVDPAGATRGNRDGKRASTANLLPQFLPPVAGGEAQDGADEKNQGAKEKPSKHDVDVIFSYLVCEEKQDSDVFPKPRSFPKNRYGKEEAQGEASPGGKSALSTQCSTPRSPGAGWVGSPFTPRKGERAPWAEFEGQTLREA
uniref:Uncharacterized protein n=1 Tax=Alexandrium catenella TaxID=2925 RepID=A0A7S1S7P2_ALECA|mmetsp:Transcript_89648/g.238141  ORF Transcript_89648/g.238141 Transcript_89648/m.238141 type:complete len:238 (+) Transcript_89648:70-783(+)|eukprot:CAMPEP_0171182906 /NCGR_PEP_ID=MMETSP0790-20130122/15009_1 /TAXON_ID=2925 /ORGANISM="Alexandrium catenella, Strain OF101" /LENGTH=237 /DNA_ID=CAMNT_0011647875 /DNA_START=61 /DNA_END=774 /DNA_ORIENTATION=+